MSLGETMRQYLTASQQATVDEMADYQWFRAENKDKFLAALEPLAYSTKLELQYQIQSYYSDAEKIYFADLMLKTGQLVREMHLDGSVFEQSDDITSLSDLNIILPEKAFNIIDRLCSEGFVAQDFAVRAEYTGYSLVLKVGNMWMRLMTLRM